MLQTFVLSNDQFSIAILESVLRQFGAGITVCRSAQLALPTLTRKHFDGVFIDYDEGPSAQLISTLRSGWTPLRSTVCCALAQTHNAMAAFKSGATLVLEKPLDGDRSQKSMQVAHGLMLREQRRYYRHAISLPVRIAQGGAWRQGESVNISENGMAILSPVPLVAGTKLFLGFLLPNASSDIHVVARVIWADRQGQAGLQFASVTLASRVLLSDWLAERMAAACKEAVRQA